MLLTPRSGALASKLLNLITLFLEQGLVYSSGCSETSLIDHFNFDIGLYNN